MKPDFQEMSGDEFLLTEEDLSPQNYHHDKSAIDAVPTLIEDITPLHRLEDIPDVRQQSNIKKEADTKIMKQLAKDDNISKDIQAVRKKLNNVPKSPVDILKDMVERGSFTKDFELFGQIWTLRSLDQSDYIQIFEESDRLAESSGRLTTLKLISVVYSIEALNGISIYNWFSDIKLEEYNNDRQALMVAVRRATRRYLEVAAINIIEKLYEKVQEIEQEQIKAVNELKNF